MSAPTLEYFEKMKARFAVVASSPELRSKITDTHIIQYNISLDGKIALTYVVNLKDFVLTEGPSAHDLEITVADEDILSLWTLKSTLVELNKAVSVHFIPNIVTV